MTLRQAQGPLLPRPSPREARRPVSKPRLRGRGTAVVRPLWRENLAPTIGLLALALGVSIGLSVALVMTDTIYPLGSSPPTLAPSPAPMLPTDTGYPATMAALAQTANQLAADANALARSQIPTPWPTATPGVVPTSTPLIRSCDSNPKAGEACQWDPATNTPLTPTPLAICGTRAPRSTCLWSDPTAVPTALPTSQASLSESTSASSTGPTPASGGAR